MKNIIKRILALGTIVALAIPSLTACGNTASAKDSASEIEDEQVATSADNIDASVDYPEEIRVGILNGSLVDAIAQEEGYYDEFEDATGVKISVYYFESGRDVNNAYASNSIDVATFGSSPISLGTTNELGYEVIYLNDLIGDVEALAVSTDITTADDLSGKTIATPFASTAHYSLLNYLEANGIEDANVIDLEPQDILAAWQRGDIDGAYVWAPVLGEIKKDANVLTSSAELAEDGIITADLSTANKEFAAKYPDLITEFINVQNKVYELIVNDKDKAVEDVVNVIQISNEEAVEQVDGQVWLSLEEQFDEKYLGTEGGESGLAETIKSTAEFHVTQGNLDSALDLEAYKNSVNSSYAKALLDK